MGPLAVTNLAWPDDALDEALDLLVRLGCQGVEIAPVAALGAWDRGTGERALLLADRLSKRGLRCVAMLGILFGADDVALFGTVAQRARLMRHLDRVAAVAGVLGAGACVFGAPRQRDPGPLSAGAAWSQALVAMREAGGAYAAVGSCLAFEANAPRYGCRFVTGTAEAARFVAEADAPGVRLQLDTGTASLGAEAPGVLTAAVPMAAHLHVSEPDMVGVGTAGTDHAAFGAAVRAGGYAGAVSIEMRLATGGGRSWQSAIERAVGVVRSAYL